MSLYKKVFLFLILFLPTYCFGFFGWGRNSDLYKLEEYQMPQINIPGMEDGQTKITFTKVGREIFEAFAKQKDHDMTQILQLLNKNSGAKYYHLYSAYCYGFYVWRRTSDPIKKETIRRVVWNIAMEFSRQNQPKWKNRLYLWTPHFIWIFVSLGAMFCGAFAQRQNEKFLENFLSRIYGIYKLLNFNK